MVLFFKHITLIANDSVMIKLISKILPPDLLEYNSSICFRSSWVFCIMFLASSSYHDLLFHIPLSSSEKRFIKKEIKLWKKSYSPLYLFISLSLSPSSLLSLLQMQNALVTQKAIAYLETRFFWFFLLLHCYDCRFFHE